MRTPSFIIFILLAILLATFIGVLAYLTFHPPTASTPSPSPPRGLRPLGPSSTPAGEGGRRPGEGTNAGAPPNRPVVGSADPLRGNPTAPITLVEFGDFLCPPCADQETVLQKILREQPAKINLVWKDLPNTRQHPLAQKAAASARCAQEQGKFWEYHDALFVQQDSLGDDSWNALARTLALNLEQFADCMDSGRGAAQVERSFNEALLLRVDATPYFFLGIKRFSGAISVEELNTAIQNAL